MLPIRIQHLAVAFLVLGGVTVSVPAQFAKRPPTMVNKWNPGQGTGHCLVTANATAAPSPSAARPGGGCPGGAAASGARAAARSGTAGAASAAPTVGAGVARGSSGRASVASGSGHVDRDAASSGWAAWWARNRDAYLWTETRASGAVTTAAAAPLSGRGRRAAESRPGLARGLTYTRVVPTLLDILADETDAGLLAEAALALGRTLEPEYALVGLDALRPLLAHPDRAVAATAALSLGLMGSEDATGELLALITCDQHGHDLVADAEVPRPVRTAAALGLGFLGDPAAATPLIDFVRAAPSELGEVQAAALIALGSITGTGRSEAAAFLSEVLAEKSIDPMLRATAPAALARLLGAGSVPALLAALDDDDADLRVRRAVVLALGAAADASQAEALEVLAEIGARERDAQTRGFALVSLAKAGARPTSATVDASVHASVRAALVRALRDPKQKSDAPFAALAAGLYGRAHVDARSALSERLADGYADTKDPQQRGAFALALGLLGDGSIGRTLRADLADTRDESLAAQLALSLGLLGHRDADGDLRALASRAGIGPDLRRDAGLALMLLDDPVAAQQLGASYADAGNIDARHGLAAALAVLRRADGLDALHGVASDLGGDPATRSSACAALGRLAEKTLLPFHARLVADTSAMGSRGEIEALLAAAF